MKSFGYTVFCDDIRQEVNGKFTLVGCYGSDLIVEGDLPSILPKFGLMIKLLISPSELADHVEFRVVSGSEKKILFSQSFELSGEGIEQAKSSIEATPIQNEGNAFITLLQNIVLSPLEIHEGLLRVRAQLGDLTIKLGSLKVRQQPRKTEQIAPSGTSSLLSLPSGAGKHEIANFAREHGISRAAAEKLILKFGTNRQLIEDAVKKLRRRPAKRSSVADKN